MCDGGEWGTVGSGGQECAMVGSVGRWEVWDGRECATVGSGGRWGVWDGREWGTVGSGGQ